MTSSGTSGSWWDYSSSAPKLAAGRLKFQVGGEDTAATAGRRR